MSNPLIMKLEQFSPFTASERERLNELLRYPTKTFKRGATIISDRSKVDDIHLVLTGLAARSKTLIDGTRQTLAFLVPGDLCDLEVFVLEAMDHDIVALTDTTCVLIPAKEVEALLTESSSLTRALWWSTMTDSAVLRERIIDHGSRDAREQLAHIFCEMLIRYRMVGETTDNSFSFPLTQEDLAEATGLTPVHLNRILQQMRTDGLVEFRRGVVKVLKVKRLMALAKFEANYLHLNRTESRDPEVSYRVGDLVEPSHHSILQGALDKIKGTFGSA